MLMPILKVLLLMRWDADDVAELFEDDNSKKDNNYVGFGDGGDVIENVDCVEVDIDVVGLDDVDYCLMMMLPMSMLSM